MKVYVIIRCTHLGSDSYDTSIIEVHTNLETANARVRELDKTIKNGSHYYDVADPVDLIESK